MEPVPTTGLRAETHLSAATGDHASVLEPLYDRGPHNDSDRYVQKRPEGGWEVVKERHERASALTNTKADAVDRARAIVKNLGGGEVRIKDTKGKLSDSDTQGRRNETRARDRK
jgi:hypothetical protein